MRKNLQLALMASPVIATFLSVTTPYVQAEPGSSNTAQVITTTTDQSGHKVYENETVSAAPVRGIARCIAASEGRAVKIPRTVLDP